MANDYSPTMLPLSSCLALFSAMYDWIPRKITIPSSVEYLSKSNPRKITNPFPSWSS
jgi:hypothetical protein